MLLIPLKTKVFVEKFKPEPNEDVCFVFFKYKVLVPDGGFGNTIGDAITCRTILVTTTK